MYACVEFGLVARLLPTFRELDLHALQCKYEQIHRKHGPRMLAQAAEIIPQWQDADCAISSVARHCKEATALKLKHRSTELQAWAFFGDEVCLDQRFQSSQEAEV